MDLISVGYSANDGAGDTLRQAGIKINTNFQSIDTDFVKKDDLGTPGNPPIISSGNTLEGIVTFRDMNPVDGNSQFQPLENELVINKNGNIFNYLSVGISGSHHPVGLFGVPFSDETVAEGGTDFVNMPDIFNLPSGSFMCNMSANFFITNSSSDEGELQFNGVCRGMVSEDGAAYTPLTLLLNFTTYTIPANSEVSIIIPLQAVSITKNSSEDGIFKFRKKTNLDGGNSITLDGFSNIVLQILTCLNEYE
jgi:hypothetical protein